MNYQEDFLTPGSIPSFANSLKQIRQTSKSLIKAFPRPQRKHRFLTRVENFAFFLLLAITDVFAINKYHPFIGDIVCIFLKSQKHTAKTLRRNTDQTYLLDFFILANKS